MCFAGSHYRAGAKFRRRQVQVAVVGDMVEISVGTELIGKYPVKHDRTREHGALANPGGSAAPHQRRLTRGLLSSTYRSHSVVRVPGLDAMKERSAAPA